MDADTSDRWFDYPIAGAPAVLLHLANDIGTDVVRVRVEDNLTDVFAARFEILIDVL